MKPSPTNRSFAALAVIPIISLVVGAYILRFYEPIYLGFKSAYFGYDFDPSYAYLFNGAAAAQLHEPGINVHPGSTSFILIALYLRCYEAVRWLLSGEHQGLLDLLIADPESALRFVAQANLVMFSACVFWLGLVARSAMGDTAGAVLIQMLPLLYSDFVRPGMIGAEATLMVAGVVLTGLLLKEWKAYRDREIGRQDWNAFLVGVCISALLFAKVTSLPLVLLIFGLQGRRAKGAAWFGFLIGGLVLLVPIAPGLVSVMRWYFEIATHSGQYGSGQAAIMDWAVLSANVAALCQRYYIVLVVLALSSGLIALHYFRERNRPGFVSSRWRTDFAISVLLAVGVQTSLVLKHFSYRYFVPSIVATAALCTLCIFIHFEHIFSPIKRWLAVAASIVGYASWFLLCMAPELPSSAAMAQRLSANAEFHRTVAELRAKSPGSIWIGAYAVHDADYAVAFGVGYAGAGLSKDLARSNKTIISYNRWNQKFWLNGDWIDAPAVQRLITPNRSVFMLIPSDLDASSIALPMQLHATLSDGTKVYRVLETGNNGT